MDDVPGDNVNGRTATASVELADRVPVQASWVLSDDEGDELERGDLDPARVGRLELDAMARLAQWQLEALLDERGLVWEEQWRLSYSERRADNGTGTCGVLSVRGRHL